MRVNWIHDNIDRGLCGPNISCSQALCRSPPFVCCFCIATDALQIPSLIGYGNIGWLSKCVRCKLRFIVGHFRLIAWSHRGMIRNSGYPGDILADHLVNQSVRSCRRGQ